ncbi:MAG: hypothetical protein WAM39_21455 [Bryobacteraceae bacterium]
MPTAFGQVSDRVVPDQGIIVTTHKLQALESSETHRTLSAKTEIPVELRLDAGAAVYGTEDAIGKLPKIAYATAVPDGAGALAKR